MSVLRPGTFLTCRALTSINSNRSSRTVQTGYQYTPVDSITTWVTPPSSSQSRKDSSPFIVVRKVRIVFSRSSGPAPGVRMHATTVFLCTSRPAHRSINTSVLRPPWQKGSASTRGGCSVRL